MDNFNLDTSSSASSWFVRLQGLLAYSVLPSFCIAALCFPFSVAASNLALTVALMFAVLSGGWWQGIRIFYARSPLLGVCFISYFVLMIAGLLWSMDVHWGLHILGRQWFWLLVPALIASMTDKQRRNIFLWAVSVGLTANLLFCVLQILGYVTITSVQGSSINDATGYIGHIGFGVIYGVWAAWLIFIGLHLQGIKRWCIWGLACWGYIMVFAAQGRSGYVVALLLVMVVLFKLFQGISILRPLAMIFGVLVLTISILFFGFGKDRVYGAWIVISGANQSVADQRLTLSKAAINYRLYMWKTALSVWSDHKLIGVGTGGFPAAVRAIYDEGNLDLNAFGGHEQKILMAHPHNQYLLNLVRWGPIGLLSLCALLFFWIKEGWAEPWDRSVAGGAVLTSLSGLALAVAGLFEPSMEEHFSAIFVVLLLGTGLAQNHDMIQKQETEHSQRNQTMR